MICCPGFQHLLDAAGQRGIAALVRRTHDDIGFLLQSRGIAFGDEQKLKPMSSTDLVINLEFTIGLRFCPFCGRRLGELVEASPEEFEKRAGDHKKFYKLP
jgi:hypothetical protein